MHPSPGAYGKPGAVQAMNTRWSQELMV